MRDEQGIALGVARALSEAGIDWFMELNPVGVDGDIVLPVACGDELCDIPHMSGGSVGEASEVADGLRTRLRAWTISGVPQRAVSKPQSLVCELERLPSQTLVGSATVCARSGSMLGAGYMSLDDGRFLSSFSFTRRSE